MKTNFEKTLKESLDQHEFDYNPDAWKALESKLDNLSPTRSPRLKKGWYLAGAAASIVAISVYYFTSSESSTPLADNKIVTTTKEFKENTTSEKLNESSSTYIDKKNSKETPDSNNDDVHSFESSFVENRSANNEELIIQDKTDITDTHTERENDILTNQNNNEEVENIVFIDKLPGKTVVLPVIESICQGERIVVENKNSVNIELHTPAETVVIKPHTTITKTADIDGTYSFVYEDMVESFQVKPSPVVHFRIHDDKYKNGVPTTTVECTVPYASLEWSYANGNSTKKTTDIHFFKKDVYPVKLEIKGLNGCYGSVTKQIEIFENFNLLAPTSFDPHSADHRVNRFLPYSLFERNIPFKMIIIDPRDGHIVYETKNASNGWDGIDMTTGNMVPMNKNYIWKVNIEENLPGESSEYAGSVLPVRRK